MQIPPDITSLRQRHPSFVFRAAKAALKGSDLEVLLDFHLDPDIDLQTKLIFHNIDTKRYASLDSAVIQNWLVQIGMVEGLSYWKASCSPEFVVEAGYLSNEQLKFWSDLIQKGMSEFFFVNNIDGWSEDFVRFTVTAKKPEVSLPIDQTPKSERTIVPLGGGKDSLVTLELLKEAKQSLAVLTVNTSPQLDQLRQMNEDLKQIRISRHLDPQLLVLNQNGYLNGHTPFSAMVSFVSTFAAYLYDYKFIALSNEWSANEGSTEFLGHQINHQYSKSWEYEQQFQQYFKSALSTQIEYFSFLRPLHELQIAQLFTNYPEYFSVFLSCNRGQRQGIWCGECAKCLFVYTMLAAFLPKETMVEIFGQDLFAKESLLPILQELSGVAPVKSLDCVGTREEMIRALFLAIKNNQSSPLPVLLQYAQDSILPSASSLATNTEEFLDTIQATHALPAAFVPILTSAIQGT